MTVDTLPSYLFVDEDPLQLSALRRLLRDMPGTKRMATSGEEALRMAEEEPPSVVIAAYILPGIDGLSLLAALRARTPVTGFTPPLARVAAIIARSRAVTRIEHCSK